MLSGSVISIPGDWALPFCSPPGWRAFDLAAFLPPPEATEEKGKEEEDKVEAAQLSFFSFLFFFNLCL